jgi:hypothetical protein
MKCIDFSKLIWSKVYTEFDFKFNARLSNLILRGLGSQPYVTIDVNIVNALYEEVRTFNDGEK